MEAFSLIFLCHIASIAFSSASFSLVATTHSVEAANLKVLSLTISDKSPSVIVAQSANIVIARIPIFGFLDYPSN